MRVPILSLRFIHVLLGLFASFLCIGLRAQPPERARQLYTNLPQSFEPNRGQADTQVDFISHGPGFTLLLSRQQADLQLTRTKPGSTTQAQNLTLRMRLVGARMGARAEARDLQTGSSNYFIGHEPSAWRTGIPQYRAVEYHEIYSGIDVVYHSDGQRLEYDFLLHAHADPRDIRLAIDGADEVHVDQTGDLVAEIGSAEIRHRKPTVYQESDGMRKPVNGRYVSLGGNRIGFELGAYDKSKPAVIDPVLVFSTYFGGQGTDNGGGIRLDAAGNIYICGTTSSTNLPGASSPGPPFSSGTDAYVAKFSPTGKLIFVTYVGGTNDQASGNGVGVDGNGNVYLAGITAAANFPVKNAIQGTYHGAQDAFVLELNSSGSALVYSTYLGGSALDYARAMEVDTAGNAYVSGSTGSKEFPTVNAAQPKFGGGNLDSFAVKIAPGGSSLVYSTFLGGGQTDFNNGMTIDPTGNAYIFGDTNSTDFPVVGAIQSTYSGGQNTGWLVKLGASGNVVYSTYYGGTGGDAIRGAKTDASGNLIMTGETASINFPIVKAIQPHYGGGMYDAWVAKLNASGSQILYSTYLGGSGEDGGGSVAVDALGNAYITGLTFSSNFPVVNAAQAANAGNEDAFLTKINATGSAILSSTYLGGSGADAGVQIAVDAAARAYIVGTTASSNFPTASPTQPAFGGGPYDAFVAVIGTCDFTFSPPNASFVSAGGSGSVSFSTTPECGWTATSNNTWIKITSAASGTGSGSVSYTIAPNTQGQSLAGSITIGAETFSVTEFGGPITLTSINPANGLRGGNAPVTLTGTNFGSDATVGVSGSGVTADVVTVVNAGQITATFAIAANASTGEYIVTVTSAGVTSNGVTFTVLSTAPVLTSLNPASGGAGNSVPVILTGSNFVAGATLTSSNPSLAFSNVTVVSATQLTAILTMAANATPGTAPVTVTTSNGSSNSVAFSIQPQFTPIRVDAGSAQPYTDPLGQVWSADTGFTGGAISTVNQAITGTPAPALYQTLHSSNSPLTYQAALPNGYYTVNLKFEENAVAQAGKRVFNVIINGQTVLSNFDIFAVAGAQYQAVDVPIAVAVTSASINIQFVPVLNATEVCAIEILAGISVAPAVSTLTPNAGSIGAAVPVTITGANLASDVVINAGPNISVSNVRVVSATQVNATLDISATARNGPVIVTLTGLGGAAQSIFTIGDQLTLITLGPNGLPAGNVSSLFNGTVGAPYVQPFTASGGTPPYTWAVISGGTDGLSLGTSSGILQGTLQSTGKFTFTIQLRDSVGVTTSQNFSLVVTVPGLTITVGAPLPGGTVGTGYSQKLPVGASGGKAPYAWSLTSAPVPGLDFNASNLVLSGTPTTSGTFMITVQALDSAGLVGSTTLSLTILPAALTITTNRQLPDATVNSPVSQQMSATGGTPPYTWSAVGLPTGLSVNATSGLISGTLTAVGSFSFAVTVGDNSKNQPFSDRFSINVNLPPISSVSISGLPAGVAPAQQFPLQITLGSPFPAAITGQATLSFAPSSGPGDKTIVFSSGGTTANFTIPAGSTTAVSDIPLAIQTGTVSGTITISLRLKAGATDITPTPNPTVTAQLVPAPPVILNTQVTRSTNAISIAITGFSTAREVTQAVFTFNAARGANPPAFGFHHHGSRKQSIWNLVSGSEQCAVREPVCVQPAIYRARRQQRCNPSFGNSDQQCGLDEREGDSIAL